MPQPVVFLLLSLSLSFPGLGQDFRAPLTAQDSLRKAVGVKQVNLFNRAVKRNGKVEEARTLTHTFIYDTNGLLVKKTSGPYIDGTPREWFLYTYDMQGHLIEENRFVLVPKRDTAANLELLSQFNRRRLLRPQLIEGETDTLIHPTRYAYDEAGNHLLTVIFTPEGDSFAVIEKGYDLQHRLIREARHAYGDWGNSQVQHFRWAGDQLITSTAIDSFISVDTTRVYHYYYANGSLKYEDHFEMEHPHPGDSTHFRRRTFRYHSNGKLKRTESWSRRTSKKGFVPGKDQWFVEYNEKGLLSQQWGKHNLELDPYMEYYFHYTYTSDGLIQSQSSLNSKKKRIGLTEYEYVYFEHD